MRFLGKDECLLPQLLSLPYLLACTTDNRVFDASRLSSHRLNLAKSPYRYDVYANLYSVQSFRFIYVWISVFIMSSKVPFPCVAALRLSFDTSLKFLALHHHRHSSTPLLSSLLLPYISPQNIIPRLHEEYSEILVS